MEKGMFAIHEKLTPDLYEPMFHEDVEMDIDELYIDRVARSVKNRLPSDYVEFLRQYPRTGICYDNVNDESVSIFGIEPSVGAPDSIYPISVLFAQSRNGDVDLLKRNLSVGEIEEYLIIGGTDGPQVYGMEIKGDNFGRIYYLSWDSIDQPPLVANSFSDLIDRMATVTLDGNRLR